MLNQCVWCSDWQSNSHLCVIADGDNISWWLHPCAPSSKHQSAPEWHSSHNRSSPGWTLWWIKCYFETCIGTLIVTCNHIWKHKAFLVLGVRTFTPNSASSGFLYVGGPAVVLSLVAMAPDDSSLYAAVKVLLSVLETNPAMQQEMIRINGYKVWWILYNHRSSCTLFINKQQNILPHCCDLFL